MELRDNNKSGDHMHIKVVEVCIDDQWHELTSSAKVANNYHSLQSISVQADSSSVTIIWSEHSIPSDEIISGYDLSCTTSALSDGQIQEVEVPNVSTSTTTIQIIGLLPGTPYECCVTAHILTNTPFDLISSSCVTTKTKSDNNFKVPGCDNLVVRLGTGLGLLLVVVFFGIGIYQHTSCDAFEEQCYKELQTFLYK